MPGFVQNLELVFVRFHNGQMCCAMAGPGQGVLDARSCFPGYHGLDDSLALDLVVVVLDSACVCVHVFIVISTSLHAMVV